MHKLKALLHPTFALLCGLVGSACVDEFKGANIQVDFGPAVPAQARQGATPIAGFQLPAPTHFRFYGIRETRDNSGAVLSSEYTELQRFEIHRIVERFSPCFLEPDEARYPGLHAAAYESRIRADTGITDVDAPPTGATEEQLIDVATAMQRSRNITALTREPGIPPMQMEPALLIFGGPKAVTSASPANYPTVGTVCADTNPNLDRSLIPPDTCTDDESNKIRRDVCNTFWANNPDFYEGTDRVLTEPLAGTYFGIVTGVSPINGAVLGGTQFFVEDPVIDYDKFAVHVLPDSASDTDMGTMLIEGRPASSTRGVIRGNLLPPVLNRQTENLVTPFAIFPDLGGDDVHF